MSVVLRRAARRQPGREQGKRGGANEHEQRPIPTGGDVVQRTTVVEHPSDQWLQDAGAEEDAGVDHGGRDA